MIKCLLDVAQLYFLYNISMVLFNPQNFMKAWCGLLMSIHVLKLFLLLFFWIVLFHFIWFHCNFTFFSTTLLGLPFLRLKFWILKLNGTFKKIEKIIYDELHIRPLSNITKCKNTFISKFVNVP